MLDLLPHRAFFHFELPIRYCAKPPRVDGDVHKWDEDYLVTPLMELDDAEPFADVYWAWNEDGFYLAYDVPNRTSRPQADPKQWWKKNGFRLCIDTRDARDNKRATRYCHLFYLLPTGGGAKGNQPVAGIHRMSRSKEPPPAVDVRKIKVASIVTRNGYSVEAAFPAACLSGWNPAEHPRIGIYYKVKDSQFGGQHLSSDDDLGWNVDPSTWATGVLVR